MKINLTKIFLDSVPVDARLPFGVVSNLRLTKISNDVKLDRKGMPYNKNCYLTFTQFDDKDKIVAESTFNYFNFSPDKVQFVKDNFVHQMIQLNEILKYCMPKDKAEGILEKVEDYVNDNIEEYSAVLGKPVMPSDVDAISETMNNLVNYVIKVTKKDIKKSEKVQMILGCDKKTGKYVDLPKEDTGFINYADAKALKMPTKYIKWRAKKDIPQTASPDVMGAEKDIIIESSAILDNDNDLDGI